MSYMPFNYVQATLAPLVTLENQAFQDMMASMEVQAPLATLVPRDILVRVGPQDCQGRMVYLAVMESEGTQGYLDIMG